MKAEYDCERCGIHVFCAIPQPDETLYCVECRFIESIEDPADRAAIAERLDARRAELEEGGAS